MTEYLAFPRLSPQREGWSWAVGLKDLRKLLNALRCQPSRHLGWHVMCMTGRGNTW